MKIFRSQSLRLLAALALSLGIMTAVSAQKDSGNTGGNDESDPTVFSLPLLADGDTIELSFEGTDGALLVAFNASEGDEVTISMVQTDDSEIDPYIVVLGAIGTILGTDDDSGDVSLSSLIEDLEIPEDGTYYVLATSYATQLSSLDSSEDGEDYTFEISVSGNNQPDDIPEGSFMYSSDGAEVGDSFSFDLDGDFPVYYVTFIAEAGDEVNLLADSEDLDTLIMLFDGLGNRVAVNDDSRGYVAELEDVELPSDGLYFALITYFGASDTGAADGTVDFSLE